MTKCSVIVAKLSQKNPRCPKIPAAQKSNRSCCCCCWEDFRRRGVRIRPKKQIWGARESSRFAPIPRDRGAQGPGTNPRGIAGSGALPTAPRASHQSCSSQCWGELEQLGRKTEILVSSEKFVGFSRWGRGRLGVQVLNSNPLRALWEFL